MVVHDHKDSLLELRRPFLQNDKSYVIVAKEVKENTTMQIPGNRKQEELSPDRQKSKIKSKKSEKRKRNEVPDDSNPSATEIDSVDLEELRNVYKKCKGVIEKIERKYGHLLGLESGNSESRKLPSSISKDECTCKKRKKIVFDDDGKQSTVDMSSEIHICVDKHKDIPNETQSQSRNIQVEYHDIDIELSDNIQELNNMLHDPDTETTLRNKVLNKIRLLKQEYNNEIRFNKHILIEKAKTNCHEIFDFKGSNLSEISGYS